MKIKEDFIENILKSTYNEDYLKIFSNSQLLRYLDDKMGAVHGNSKTRKSLGNIYAIYSILYFYSNEFYENKEKYRNFEGYEYTKLFSFFRGLYGGSKLQNHALNSRVNGEFKNKFPNILNDLIIVNNGKYLIHIDYLYIEDIDITKVTCKIIEEYINLLIEKDHKLIKNLDELKKINNLNGKIKALEQLLDENAEARIFEIISYAILKNHYKNIKVYFGYSMDKIKEDYLHLYKTGRTNANDGGIDFVMKPEGRFFQVTEVSNYDKYLLDIDKVVHFPITFVVKTKMSQGEVLKNLLDYIALRSNGMKVIEDRYSKAIEEIITINELKKWINGLCSEDIDNIIKDIELYYKLEMNIQD